MSPDRSDARILRSVSLLSAVEWTAFFAAYIVMGLYLVEVAGFGDVGAGWAASAFGLGLCILPSFAGGLADRVGFRRTLVASYVLQSGGFAILSVARSPLPAIAGLALVAIGGASSRAVLLGSVGRTDPQGRTRAYSVLMQAINVGCFVGKLVARPLRLDLGIASVDAFAALAFLGSAGLALWMFRPIEDDTPRPQNHVMETLRGMALVLRDPRFVGMITQVGLFWAVQGQMYVTMPRYAVRLAGPEASPEWYAMVNSVVVVALILPVNRWTRHWTTVRTLPFVFGLLAVSTVVMGLGPWLVTASGGAWHLGPFLLSPFTATFVAGSALSGVAECFLLPRFLERVAALAPPGQAALYQGFGYLNGLVSNLVGWGLSGYLIDRWCPDPAGVPGAVEALARAAAGQGPWPQPWAQAPWIFVSWSAVACVAIVLLPSWHRTGKESGAAGGAPPQVDRP